MLVWKTQTLNVLIASLRYRCLLPLRYLDRQGIRSKIVPGVERIKLTCQTQAIIFVKSFREEDVEACEQAYQLGVPIILDLCDNIFVDGYAAESDYVPAHNFRLMARRASAIVTTGSAMKAQIEKVLTAMNIRRLIVVIPDGNESLDDIEFAFQLTRSQRLSNLIKRQIFKKGLWPLQAWRRLYRVVKKRLKIIFFAIKGILGKGLRRCGLLAPRPDELLDSSAQEIAQEIAQEMTSEMTTEIAIEIGDSQIMAQSSPSAPKRTQPLTRAIKHAWAQARPKPWPQAAVGVKTVLWFGNQGAKYGNFGMLNILDVAAALEQHSQKQPLRLMVVSNSYEKYSNHIAPLPFETDYLPWHPRKIYDYIRASDVVIMPNSQSDFSICKSANRAVLALSQGVPVIASHTPALEIFADCMWLDDWHQGLQSYLLQPEIAQAHVARAQQLIEQHFSGEAIAQHWLNLLNDISRSNHPAMASPSSPVSLTSAESEGVA